MSRHDLPATFARSLVALVFALALAGCDREGVCVDGNYCTAFVRKSTCKGEWHQFQPGDDTTFYNGGRTCSALGFRQVSGGTMYRR